MSKVKMRCITCGKWFQSANAKEVTCPECMQKARKEKMAAKTAPTSSTKTPGTGTSNPARTVPPPPPKPASSGSSHWFDSVEDVKVGEPDQPPQRPKLPPSPAPRDNRSGPERFDNRGPGPGGYREGSNRGPGGYRDERGPGGYREDRGPGGYREGPNRGPGGYHEDRGPGGYRVGGPGISGGIGQRPRQPMEGGFGRGTRPGVADEARQEKFRPGGRRDGKPTDQKTKPKPATPPKPKREKIPPPAPFTPTPEQVAQVENRYLELATPTEFDGIRTQISSELGIPKKAVKKIVKELRDRQGIPSWWEMQTYKGDSEELEKIKQAYEPYLPLPPVGVHKTIAEELSLKPGDVYQAIKAIRLEMNLPQYNDPALHGLELKPKKDKSSISQEEEGTKPADMAGEATEAVPAPTDVSVETTEAAAAPADTPAESTPAATANDTTETATASADTPAEIAEGVAAPTGKGLSSETPETVTASTDTPAKTTEVVAANRDEDDKPE